MTSISIIYNVVYQIFCRIVYRQHIIYVTYCMLYNWKLINILLQKSSLNKARQIISGYNFTFVTFLPHHQIFTIKFNCILNHICRKKVQSSKKHLLTSMTLSSFLTLFLREVHFGPW